MRVINRKLGKSVVAFAIVGVLTFALNVIPASAATTSLQSWWLADSGKHLDWDGGTTYQTQFDQAVTTWNNYKSGVIRPDSLTVVQDVYVSDYSATDGYAGLTWPDGRIQFNTNYMSGYTANQKRNVCTHELGHALGLDHNQSGDVMYYSVSSVIALSANDKASYDSSYTRF